MTADDSDELARLEDFINLLAHDLRNPLNVVMTGAQVISGHLTDERSERALRRVVTAAERMSVMITQLSELIRARRGELALSRERVDLAEVVQRAIDERRGTHPDREISLDLAAGGRLTGDTDRLRQMFSNLIATALEESPGYPVLVSVTERAGERVVEIHDQGTPSRRLDLGLLMAEHIAAAHGGRVTVATTEGTVRSVILPTSPT